MKLCGLKSERCCLARRASGALAQPRGFTVLELLIVIGIIGVLLAILLPSLRGGLAQSRSFRCQMSLRGIAFDFSVFADPQVHGGRGRDDDRFGPNRFSLGTFAEAQYGIGDFWPKTEAKSKVVRPTDPSMDPLRCSEVAGEVTMERGRSLKDGAIGPAENVSYTFNSRMMYIEAEHPETKRLSLSHITLSLDILTRSMVPLVWDVDGGLAEKKDFSPHFSAPDVDGARDGPYSDDAAWSPGLRHIGKGNFALIDGSVHSSSTPLSEGWLWNFQPRR
jgi:prepilin-type N-terminal cleavage/methylation domain-containing protein/prepilin-type processing-associated H-X9-DG protein